MGTLHHCQLLIERVDGLVIIHLGNGEIVSSRAGEFEFGGPLGSGDDVRELGHQLDDLVEHEGCTRLLLDFGKVPLISTALLGPLLVVKAKVEKAEGCLKLCGLAPPVREAFRVTGYDRAFEIYSDEQAALET